MKRCCKKWEEFSEFNDVTFVYCPECGTSYIGDRDCHCEELEAFVKYVKNNVHNANKTQTIYNKARQLRGEL
jgi:hypothetical protein